MIVTIELYAEKHMAVVASQNTHFENFRFFPGTFE